MATTKRKNGRPPHTLLQVPIPKDLKMDLKIFCAESDMKMKSVVTQALRAFLK